MRANRRYPEQVYATMRRIKHQTGIIKLRTDTRIIFTDDDLLLGTVFMTNPGSYGLKSHDQWDCFIRGEGSEDIIDGTDAPDTTMQNIIEVVKKSCDQVQGYELKGYLSIYNITSVVEPDGEKIQNYHQAIINLFEADGMDTSVLYESPVYREAHFHEQCENSSFVIMGFLNNILSEHVQRLNNWGNKHHNKLVFASDKQGYFAHPFRWRLDQSLKQQAVDRLVAILKSTRK
ncbi:hypothetical protein OB236_32415 [Paenibacillus sp. WQ 127069]|uniref:Uncharacterized protein n=1 Tax=Paenibacillus baimaensis TaxID=2982185 RepID=A0ABT2UQB7_9BACL|nr:hypothetical protein [Paenibacillus sp. WQ 127069]MCU6796840.1 hypothetical protein [Paenibacillus sp. WQ 127069]